MIEQNMKSKAEDSIQILMGGAFLIIYDVGYWPETGMTGIQGNYLQIIGDPNPPTPEPKRSFPLWAIILLSVLGVMILAALAFFLSKCVQRKRAQSFQ